MGASWLNLAVDGSEYQIVQYSKTQGKFYRDSEGDLLKTGNKEILPSIYQYSVKTKTQVIPPEYRGEKDMEVIPGNLVLGSFPEVSALTGMKTLILSADGFFAGKANYFH